MQILELDSSESARKTKRQLQSELDDLLKEQENTLYDQSIEDQENSLDQMLKNSEEQAENYLKNSEVVFVDALNYVNANSATVASNIEKIAKETGYDVSSYITDAWESAGNAVTNYANGFATSASGIQIQIGLITQKWNEACLAAEAYAESAAKATAQQYTEHTGVGADNNGSSSSQSNQPNTGAGTSSVLGAASPVTGNIIGGVLTGMQMANKAVIASFIAGNKKDPVPGAKYASLNQYLLDNYGGVLSKSDEAKLAALLGVKIADKALTGEQGKADLDKILQALKSAGFSSGGVINARNLRSLTGEDGFALVSHGESILTKVQTDALKNLAPIAPRLVDVTGNLIKNLPQNTGVQTVVPNIEINTTIEGVATNEVAKEFENIAKRQVEEGFRRANNAAYAKGVRWK